MLLLLQMEKPSQGKDNIKLSCYRIIMEELSKRGVSCCPFRDGGFEDKTAENRIADCIATIAILTANSLETKYLLFSIQAASFHYKETSRIILVHAAESCAFPVPPPSLVDCFSEKAITWLSCYVKEGVDQILQKFKEEKTSWVNSLKQTEQELKQEDLTTRVFLSHKRSTGQGIVGRLYEGKT